MIEIQPRGVAKSIPFYRLAAHCRKRSGKSQAEVAERINCADNTVARWETDQRAFTAPTVALYALTLRDSPEDALMLLQSWCRQCPVEIAWRQIEREMKQPA